MKTYQNIEINEEPTDVLVFFHMNSDNQAEIDSIEDMRGNVLDIEPTDAMHEECELFVADMETIPTENTHE